MNLTRGRRSARRWMRDACTIRTASTPGDYDPETGSYPDDEAGDVVYTGACRVGPALRPTNVEAGEALVPLQNRTLWLPWDVADVEVDQVVTIDASNDPYFDDRKLRVIHVEGATDTVYRRLLCEDTQDVSQPSGS